MWPDDLVISALEAPQQLAHWPAEAWSALFRQARVAGLLGRITQRADAGTPWPAAAQGHVQAAARQSRAQAAEIERELHFIGRALAGLPAPVLLLKGAAYAAAGLPPAQGRVFSDIDIMVPKAAIAEAESRLAVAGWITTHHSAYDQRYYRQWMHELPPMQHVHRQTTIDVHHAILPETARLRCDPGKLFASAIPLAGRPGFHVLCPIDMVLHSMTHLFMNDDMSHALRDLSDLDLLLRHFGTQVAFWQQIAGRAGELGLRRPLFYGLRYTQRLLGTPVPAEVRQTVATAAPGWPLRALMDAIWLRALRSPHPSARPPLAGAALFALYVRGHWMRMPAALLMRHLTVKLLRLHERPVAPAATAPR